MRWGGGGGGGVEIKMPLCGCTGALAAIAVSAIALWSPFVKTAAPMTKTSASTCAPFVALTGKFFGKLFSTGKLVSFCLLFMLCLFCITALLFCPPKISTGKYHYTTKNRQYQSFLYFFNSRHFIPPCPFPRHSRAEGAGIQHNRVAIIHQSQNQSAVIFPLSPPLTRGQIRGNVGFPPLRGENDAGRAVIPAQAGINSPQGGEC